MINVCSNRKCNKVFFFKPLHIGLGNICFCSASCKENHIYDEDEFVASPISRKKQCPHCHKLFSSSSPAQTICQNKTCAAIQRKNKAILRDIRQQQNLGERTRKMYQRNEAMEAAMINAIAKNNTTHSTNPKNTPIHRSCSECGIEYTTKLNPNNTFRPYCYSDVCKKSYKAKYARAQYDKFKARYDGKDDEKRSYVKICNDRAKVRKQIAKQKELGIVPFQGETVLPQSIPLQRDSIPVGDLEQQVMKLLEDYKKEVESKYAKYASLLYYLETNKIDDMAKMSELIAIIGRITS